MVLRVSIRGNATLAFLSLSLFFLFPLRSVTDPPAAFRAQAKSNRESFRKNRDKRERNGESAEFGAGSVAEIWKEVDTRSK